MVSKYLLFRNSGFHKILLENVVGVNMCSVSHSFLSLSLSSTKMGFRDLENNDATMYKPKALMLMNRVLN